MARRSGRCDSPSRPASGATTWLLRLFGQQAARRVSALTDTLDPIPDNYSNWFIDGFIAYAHRHSANPVVRARYPAMKAEWLGAMDAAVREGNREEENYGFYPGRTVMDGRVSYGPTVGDPLNWRGQ